MLLVTIISLREYSNTNYSCACSSWFLFRVTFKEPLIRAPYLPQVTKNGSLLGLYFSRMSVCPFIQPFMRLPVCQDPLSQERLVLPD